MSDVTRADFNRAHVAGAVAPGCRIGRDGKPLLPSRWSWPESRLNGLEHVLESGNLDWAERILDSERTALILKSEDAAAIARVEAVRAALPAARAREAAAGGKGSLIDPGHSMTLFAQLPPGGPTHVAVRHGKDSWRHAAASVPEDRQVA